jgi:hypothetical protein
MAVVKAWNKHRCGPILSGHAASPLECSGDCTNQLPPWANNRRIAAMLSWLEVLHAGPVFSIDCSGRDSTAVNGIAEPLLTLGNAEIVGCVKGSGTRPFLDVSHASGSVDAFRAFVAWSARRLRV